ncbi:SWIM zinc finger family protein [Solwaraspora sp. WMMB335]|uniref:SWIM zinc finger family protein n=1 Tax=Solwaraspora sp. WMMB335 TaxID=3404118 RepID=UPI003B92C425
MSSFADFGRPRRVDGGLRARSTRGAIGQSWWSRRFVGVLESFALGTRLSRGRSYARAGQVLALTVAPGAVTAQVQGSRPRPYRVRIGLPPFAESVWRDIERTLAGQALFSARLLAGDLPPELEEVFVAAGAPLFPAGIDELTLDCNCPDGAVPCKHLAATFYLLAEEFDADPFQILHWRGRSRPALLDRLRSARARPVAAGPAVDDAPLTVGTPAGSAGPAAGLAPAGLAPVDPAPVDPAPADPAPVGASRVLAGLPEPSAPVDVGFWRPPVPLPARAPVLPARPGLLLRQLGVPSPSVGGPGLVTLLSGAYQRFGADSRLPAAGP